MTLAEKIGQMTQAELSVARRLERRRRAVARLGPVRRRLRSQSGQQRRPPGPTPTTPASGKRSPSRLKIPLLFGIDAMHGHSNVLGAVIFPHNVGLGCTRDAELVEEIGRVTALEVRATGINWAFAPCVTVPQDDRWGRTYEGFGEDPALSRRAGRRAGSRPAGRRPGRSAARAGLRQALCRRRRHDRRDARHDQLRRGARGWRSTRATRASTKPTFRAVHLAPYPPTIAAGVGSIMVSYSSWNGLKCTANESAAHRHSQGRAGLRGARDLRLQRDRADRSRFQDRDQEVDQRGHRHGDGARPTTASSSSTSRRWSKTATCRWSGSTTRCGASCA